MVDDLRSGQIEHQLLTALRPGPTDDPDRPVRVGGEQLAALADHLGFDPQPEAEAERLDPPSQTVDPVGQLAPVDDPVPERARVIVTGAEPAVVEDKQLDPEVAGDAGDIDQLRLIEVEVRPFPVVDQDRPRPIAPGSPGQALAV